MDSKSKSTTSAGMPGGLALQAKKMKLRVVLRGRGDVMLVAREQEAA